MIYSVNSLCSTLKVYTRYTKVYLRMTSNNKKRLGTECGSNENYFQLFQRTLNLAPLFDTGKPTNQVVGYDPLVPAEEASKFNVEFLQPEQIWPIADYITLHVPLIKETRNLINKEVLNSCKKGVKIVNVARGGIIDDAALLEALEDGRCGGTALDVFEQEPPTDPVTLKVIQHPKVVATPHLGASTIEAQVRVAVEVAEQFVALTGKSSQYTTAPGVINPSVL